MHLDWTWNLNGKMIFHQQQIDFECSLHIYPTVIVCGTLITYTINVNYCLDIINKICCHRFKSVWEFNKSENLTLNI